MTDIKCHICLNYDGRSNYLILEGLRLASSDPLLLVAKKCFISESFLWHICFVNKWNYVVPHTMSTDYLYNFLIPNLLAWKYHRNLKMQIYICYLLSVICTSIRTTMQNLESVAQKMSELLHCFIPIICHSSVLLCL